MLELQATALRDSGYDVLNVGRAELRAGPEVLRRLTAETRSQWVSSNVRFPSQSVRFPSQNVRFPSQDDALVKPYVVLELSGLKVGVLGVTTGAESAAGVSVDEPKQALAALVPEVRRQVDLVLVLADLGPEDVRTLIEAGLDVDVVVGARADAPRPPVRMGRSVVTSVGSDGRGVGRLLLGLDGRGRIVGHSGQVLELTSWAAPPQ